MQQPATPDRFQQAQKDFGARVRSLREALGLSQRGLAEKLEAAGFAIDPSAVTRIERGDRSVKVTEATVIAAALGTSVGQLAGEAEEVDVESMIMRAERLRDDLLSKLIDWAQLSGDVVATVRQRVPRETRDNYRDVMPSYYDYFGWMLERAADEWPVGLAKALVDTEDDREALRDVLMAIFDSAVI